MHTSTPGQPFLLRFCFKSTCRQPAIAGGFLAFCTLLLDRILDRDPTHYSIGFDESTLYNHSILFSAVCRLHAYQCKDHHQPHHSPIAKLSTLNQSSAFRHGSDVLALAEYWPNHVEYTKVVYAGPKSFSSFPTYAMNGILHMPFSLSPPLSEKSLKSRLHYRSALFCGSGWIPVRVVCSDEKTWKAGVALISSGLEHKLVVVPPTHALRPTNRVLQISMMLVSGHGSSAYKQPLISFPHNIQATLIALQASSSSSPFLHYWCCSTEFHKVKTLYPQSA